MPDPVIPNNTSLSLYVHWPFCLSKCPYCDFNSHVAGQIDADAWQAALITELAFMAEQAGTLAQPPTGRFQLNSIFFGGGTPSLMPPQIVAAVIDKACGLFSLADDCEITAEMNPTSVEIAKLKQFADAGINRVSVGIQSLEPDGLSFLGREHSTDEALAALDAAQRHFGSVSADLIYGLPDQTTDNWSGQLDRILGFGLSHLSCYQLTIEPGTVFHTRARQGDILTADDDHVADLYLLTDERLTAAGLPGYEVSNYAQPGKESQHNLNYWRSGDWVAIGPGAHGRLSTQQGRLVMENRKSPEGWLADVSANGHGCQQQMVETHRQSFEDYWMMGLRLNDGVPWPDPAAFGGQGYRLNTRWLDMFLSEGWLEQTSTYLRATRQGRLRLNTILVHLLSDEDNELRDRVS